MPKKKGDDNGTKPTTVHPGTVETRGLTDLRRNPRQDENFHPLSDQELDRLAEDMKLNGQRTPVEVTPDGRIIDGHQRCRAAEMLDWTEVFVVVRHDLAGDEAAIERRMIEANLNRRQLDALDRVRLARRMLEIERKLKPGGLSDYAVQDLRDRLGEMLGMSGRNVQRYLNILGAPMEVQRAFSAGTLSMKLAEKVAQLTGVSKAEISSEISAGGNPAAIVAAYLPDAPHAEIDPDREYGALISAASRAVEALDGRVGEVRGSLDPDPEIETLKQAAALIARLVARQVSLKKQSIKERSRSGMSSN